MATNNVSLNNFCNEALGNEATRHETPSTIPTVPSQKNFVEETRNLTWTSYLGLETLTLGASSAYFELTSGQIILLLIALKVSALALPVLLSMLPPTTFLIGAGVIAGTLILLLVATLAFHGISSVIKHIHQRSQESKQKESVEHENEPCKDVNLEPTLTPNPPTLTPNPPECQSATKDLEATAIEIGEADVELQTPATPTNSSNKKDLEATAIEVGEADVELQTPATPTNSSDKEESSNSWSFWSFLSRTA